MTTTAKIFLAISLLAFAASFTGPGSDILYGLLKPLAAIFFILFFITHLLAREMAQFDAESRARKPADSESLHPEPHEEKRGPLTHSTRAA